MATIKEQISADITTAMKAKDEFTRDTLRGVLSLVQTEEKKLKDGQVFSDEQVQKVLTQQVRQRQDSAAQYREFGVEDRAAAEEKEIAIIRKYLPEQTSEAEVAAIVDEFFAQNTVTNFGEAMKNIVPLLKGRADNKLVSKLVKAHLG